MMPKQLLVVKKFQKNPKFSINFFRNSNVSLELKQKEQELLGQFSSTVEQKLQQ